MRAVVGFLARLLFAVLVIAPAFVLANLLGTALVVSAQLAAARGRWRLANDALTAREGIWFAYEALYAQIDGLTGGPP